MIEAFRLKRNEYRRRLARPCFFIAGQFSASILFWALADHSYSIRPIQSPHIKLCQPLGRRLGAGRPFMLSAPNPVTIFRIMSTDWAQTDLLYQNGPASREFTGPEKKKSLLHAQNMGWSKLYHTSFGLSGGFLRACAQIQHICASSDAGSAGRSLSRSAQPAKIDLPTSTILS